MDVPLSSPMPRLLVAALLGLVVMTAACTSQDGGSPTAAPTARSEATPDREATDAPTPTSTAPSGDRDAQPRRTGDPQLDLIIEAVEERDVASLASLIDYQVVGCTKADGLGGPPKCEPQQEEGELMRVFPFSACEGGWTGTGTQLVGTFAHQTRGLWGVLNVESYPPAEGWPEPDTLLVFHASSGDQSIATYLEVTDGRITRQGTACGGGLDALLSNAAFSLEITAGPWDNPDTGNDGFRWTGRPTIDVVLEAVEQYDVVTLTELAQRAMRDLPPVGCVERVDFPGDVACAADKGERPGELVSVFPVAYCEGVLVRDPRRTIQGLLNQVPTLYAVVEAPAEPSQSDLYRHGAYWLVYELAGEPQQVSSAVRLHVTESGEVTVLWYGCLPPVEELAEWNQQPLPRITVRQM